MFENVSRRHVVVVWCVLNVCVGPTQFLFVLYPEVEVDVKVQMKVGSAVRSAYRYRYRYFSKNQNTDQKYPSYDMMEM